jgi:DNA-binding response OmpR family regulator
MPDADRVLVVDDEANIRLTLATLLRRAGFDVTAAEGGKEAIALLAQQTFDLMVVDLKMPEVDGMQVVATARLRQPDIAIIVLTGHGSMETAIEGMHQGVFDYLLKTTEPAQVVDRVRAALVSRGQQQRQRALIDMASAAIQELRGGRNEPADVVAGPHAITVGALQLDPWQQVATLGERTLSLTPTEFRVLLCLAEHAGNMRSYSQLVRCAQGYDVEEAEASELIKPHIHHLRQKLEPDPAAPRYILNIRGKGYMLSPIGE